MRTGCAIQSDLDRPAKRVNRKPMKFIGGKGKPLHLGKKHSRHQYQLEGNQLESSFLERDLGMLVNTKLNMSLQYALATQAANSTLKLYRSVAGRLRQATLLLYSALAGLALGSPVQDRLN